MDHLTAIFAVFLLMVIGGGLYHKCRDVYGFADQVTAYKLAPVAFSLVIARGVILFEFSTCIMLLAVTWTHLAGFVGAAVLTSIYSTAIAINLTRGNTAISCGCSWGDDSSSDRITVFHFLRSAMLAGIAAAGVVLVAYGPPPANLLTFVYGIAFAAPLLILYLSADMLLLNWSGFSRE